MPFVNRVDESRIAGGDDSSDISTDSVQQLISWLAWHSFRAFEVSVFPSVCHDILEFSVRT